MPEAIESARGCYRPRDVARMLDVSISTILRWIHEGRLPPPLRPGPRTLRWPAEVIHAAINEMYQTAQGK